MYVSIYLIVNAYCIYLCIQLCTAHCTCVCVCMYVYSPYAHACNCIHAHIHTCMYVGMWYSIYGACGGLLHIEVRVQGPKLEYPLWALSCLTYIHSLTNARTLYNRAIQRRGQTVTCMYLTRMLQPFTCTCQNRAVHVTDMQVTPWHTCRSFVGTHTRSECTELSF